MHSRYLLWPGKRCWTARGLCDRLLVHTWPSLGGDRWAPSFEYAPTFASNPGADFPKGNLDQAPMLLDSPDMDKDFSKKIADTEEEATFL